MENRIPSHEIGIPHQIAGTLISQKTYFPLEFTSRIRFSAAVIFLPTHVSKIRSIGVLDAGGDSDPLSLSLEAILAFITTIVSPRV
jgi:hypothetical protein